MWKRRLQNKIKELASKDKDINNFRHWKKLKRKYSIRVNRLNIVIEELKQRITAIAAKVRRYQRRVDSYRKFENNLKIFKGSFVGNYIRKKKDVMMISLRLKNRKSFGETYEVSLQIIRRMQSGCKNCKVKLMLQTRRRYILPQKV